jgi:hypothetical protein
MTVRALGARLLLGTIVLGTLFPITAAVGLWGCAMVMASGFGAILAGRVQLGFPLVAWSALAFYGLATLIELMAHFWRTPHQSPKDKSFSRHVTGLAFGWLAVVASAVGVITRTEYAEWSFYAVVYSISLIPTALALTFWLWLARARSRAAGSAARAGGGER